MHCKVVNKSDLSLDKTLPLIKSLYSYAQKKMGFQNPADITFQSDSQNASKDLGKTGFYNPSSYTITIYTDKRHIKDVLRSIAHELVHHDQNCCGAFEEPFEAGPGYAQKDNRLRDLERDAYERGNMIFRDWEDTYKQGINETTYYRKEVLKMPNNNLKEDDLRKMIRKALNEKLNKKNAKVIREAPQATKETGEPEGPTNDDWYRSNLFESLRKKWAK